MKDLKFYTEKEAAALLGIGISTLRKERKAGRIGYIELASRPSYTIDIINKYIERNTKEPTCPEEASPDTDAARSSSTSGRTHRTGTSATSTDYPDRLDAKALARQMSRKRMK